jgi:hypothetical protein
MRGTIGEAEADLVHKERAVMLRLDITTLA